MLKIVCILKQETGQRIYSTLTCPIFHICVTPLKSLLAKTFANQHTSYIITKLKLQAQMLYKLARYLAQCTYDYFMDIACPPFNQPLGLLNEDLSKRITLFQYCQVSKVLKYDTKYYPISFTLVDLMLALISRNNSLQNMQSCFRGLWPPMVALTYLSVRKVKAIQYELISFKGKLTIGACFFCIMYQKSFTKNYLSLILSLYELKASNQSGPDLCVDSTKSFGN